MPRPKTLINLYKEWRNDLIQQIRKAVSEGKKPEDLHSIIADSLNDNFRVSGVDIEYINEILKPCFEFEDLNYSVSFLDSMALDYAIAAVLLTWKSNKLSPTYYEDKE